MSFAERVRNLTWCTKYETRLHHIRTYDLAGAIRQTQIPLPRPGLIKSFANLHIRTSVSENPLEPLALLRPL